MTKRDGISFDEQLLHTNRDDPQYARYLVPLPNAADEALAQEMASFTWPWAAARFCADITEQEADRVFEQILIDARRMICDPEYDAIFADECVPGSRVRRRPPEAV
jgi:hypothetical protein